MAIPPEPPPDTGEPGPGPVEGDPGPQEVTPPHDASQRQEAIEQVRNWRLRIALGAMLVIFSFFTWLLIQLLDANRSADPITGPGRGQSPYPRQRDG